MAWVVGLAGGGSSGYSGGGGGSGSSGGGGASFVTGDGSLGPIDYVVIAIGAIAILYQLAQAVRGLLAEERLRRRRRRNVTVRTWRRRRARARRVALAAAEAADDAPHFAVATVRAEAATLYRDVQDAWSENRTARLAELLGAELLVEWRRRLADFARKDWKNVVVVGRRGARVEYLGLVHRATPAEDRAVVRVSATVKDIIIIPFETVSWWGRWRQTIRVHEYWTLARRDGRWIVVSVEADAEGVRHLTEPIVATPAADGRLADESTVELATSDAPPPGVRSAELADVDFDGDARAKALDLALADPRFSPDVLEASVRKLVGAWVEAVDGPDDGLRAVATATAVDALLGAGGATRVVVRGVAVEAVRIALVDTAREPASVALDVDVRARRYRQDRDTAAVLDGHRDRVASRTERWTLTLRDDADAPWVLSAVER